MKKQIFFTIIILSLIFAGIALSAVPIETWHGLKIFADGLYVVDANTAVISTSGNITSKELYLTSLDANTVTYLDANKKITSSTVSKTELGYLDNVTSAIQTQFTGKVSQSSGKTATIHNSIDLYGTDATAITFPSSSCNLAGVDTGKSSTIHNSIEIYGTDSTLITLPAVSSTLLGTNSSDIAATKHLQPATDDTYYIGKNDDDTPAAYKGLILKDTTNGKYYRIEIINGTITATDLTD